MSTEAVKETHGFQAEVKQVLKLVIRSLYSNKEIFLRELISNASDAIDKCRYESLADSSLLGDATAFQIRVSYDAEAKTVTISDNGIGMTHDDLIQHLGTIAKSGTREFLDNLSGDQAKDAQLIGQFGVGFYSSFIVADHVTVCTRRAGATAEEAVQWESTGEGDYTIERINKDERGTDVILHLREEEGEFLDDWRLRNIITKYSDHISVPIEMLKTETPEVSEEEEGEQEKVEPVSTWEAVNQATALWCRPKSEIKDDEYKQFYKHIGHDFEDPLSWVHNKVEGKLSYTSLLFIPARAPFDLWQHQRQHGLKLYVNRVFIMDEAEHFLPNYLRFVRGIIDSNDLPLNVSREILQGNKVVDTIRSAVVKRTLGALEKMSEDVPEDYAKFWKQFGQVIKEGPAEDFVNRERIGKLLRFSSTETDSPEQTVSLEDYVKRMREGQEKIYYITAESFNAACNNPHLEIFRKKGIEVLLLSDRVDEWLVGHMPEFDGKSMQSVAKGDLDLGDLDDEETKQQQEKAEKDFESIIEQVKKVLDEKVKDVRLTHRLTDSPACVVSDTNDMSGTMQRMLQAAGQDMPETKPIFEMNPVHPIVMGLKHEQDDEAFADLTHLLFEQALIAEGAHLDDPASFTRRMNKLLAKLIS